MTITITTQDNAITITVGRPDKEEPITHQAKSLRELRLSKGLTQREVGERTGIVPNTLSSIENKRMRASDRIRVKLAKLYDIPLDQLPLE